MSDTHVDQAAEAANKDEPRTDAAVLETLRRERDDAQDHLLRLQAEFDNYRKRVERERRELHEHFTAELLTDFLPVLDDVERALEAARGSSDPLLVSHRQGLELIEKQFLEVLKRRQVAPIAAHGADFDPNVHEAVVHEPSADHRDGEVIQELRRGYKLGERLLRPAMVKVAKSS